MIQNAKFVGFYFNMNTSVWGDFRICISVPLKQYCAWQIRVIACTSVIEALNISSELESSTDLILASERNAPTCSAYYFYCTKINYL